MVTCTCCVCCDISAGGAQQSAANLTAGVTRSPDDQSSREKNVRDPIPDFVTLLYFRVTDVYQYDPAVLDFP